MEAKAVYDLAMATDWEYDEDFLRLVEESAEAQGLSVFTVCRLNLMETLARLEEGSLILRFLFDRASNTSPEFLPVQMVLRKTGVEVLEPVEKLRWASDKATMHLEFIAGGLNTPHTIILPSFESAPVLGLTPGDLAPLSSPFVIKPANTTGGSLGVIADARFVEDVRRARLTYPADKYLLQEKVIPCEAEGRRFWFRGFFALGSVHLTWWSDLTHLYADLAPEEASAFNLEPLAEIVRRIAAVCRLQFFSTEIARDREGRYIVIDYVNESCDMRLQSRHGDGVPDAIVKDVAGRIASYVRESLASGCDGPQPG